MGKRTNAVIYRLSFSYLHRKCCWGSLWGGPQHRQGSPAKRGHSLCGWHVNLDSCWPAPWSIVKGKRRSFKIKQMRYWNKQTQLSHLPAAVWEHDPKCSAGWWSRQKIPQDWNPRLSGPGPGLIPKPRPLRQTQPEFNPRETHFLLFSTKVLKQAEQVEDSTTPGIVVPTDRPLPPSEGFPLM